MSMPFISPEQISRERADFARKGIARGRALAAMQYNNGILLVAENPSSNLRKIGEIYDRIAFAGVGKFNEFENLRQFGVRQADLLGFQFSRRDVEGRNIANTFAQVMGQPSFENKPLEVEILIAEVGFDQSQDSLYRVTFDGNVMDEDGVCVIGGDSEAVMQRLAPNVNASASLEEALKIAATALSGPDRTLHSHDFEVAVLARGEARRCFSRISKDVVASVIGA